MRDVVYKFGEFELDRSAYQLRREGRPVTLERIPLDLLFFLAERPGRLVTREQILDRIWGKNIFLDIDSAINTAVRKVRRALRDNADAPRFVETVPAKGYRFLASVSEAQGAADSSAASPPKTSLVGRVREISVVSANLDWAASGTGRLVLISGEPGIGKSKLAGEVVKRVHAKGMAVLSGRCLDDEQAVPFLPFVEMLESIVDRASGAEELRSLFGEQGGELTRLLPRLRTLVPDFLPRTDLGPVEARRYLFNSFCAFVLHIAQQSSALLLLEDLHWADGSTLSLLDHLIQRLRDAPVLVLGTYRDSEADMTPGLRKYLEKLLRERTAAGLKLKPLLPEEVAEMLEGLSGQQPPPGVIETIFGESQGNAFLIEELFRYLQEEGRLYDSEGKFHPRLVVGERDAPPSVQLIVTRRLERLSAQTRQMLANAAVIGRSFDLDLVRASTEGDAEAILACMEEAEKAGFISFVAERPKLRFEFAHELIRQAIIARLSVARHQAIHLKIAEALARMPASEGNLAELAQHYRRGGNCALAADYLHRAGVHARGRLMYTEAESYFAGALEEVDAIPPTPERDALELRVRSSFGEAIAARNGYAAPEVLDMATRARALAERTGDLGELVRQLWMEVAVATTRGELSAAAKLIDELLAAAEREGNPIGLAMAYTVQVENRFLRGDFVGSEESFERGRRFFEAPGFVNVQYGPVAAFGEGGWTAWVTGCPDLARERLRQASVHTRQSPYEVAVLAMMGSTLHLLMREFPEAEAIAKLGLAYAEERGFSELAMWNRSSLAEARGQQGCPAEGLVLLHQVIDEMKSSGGRIGITRVLTLIAEMQSFVGTVDEALETVAGALTANPEELYFRPETYRVSGELRLLQGRPAPAEADFRKAVEIAQKMSAKSWELRATTSLSRLLRDMGRRDEARTMLAGIYDWFTEGFDTRDLKDAKELLQQLSR